MPPYNFISRVYGVPNLRLADLSVMPEVISGNTNAPVVMIAEKLAEMVKRDHGFEQVLEAGRKSVPHAILSRIREEESALRDL